MTQKPGQLAIGSVYIPKPQKNPPDAHTLPPSRTYRAVCVEESDDTVLECVMCATHKEAHYNCLNWDDQYDYPQQYYFVERSLDGGHTWEMYSATEFIAGRPAWTYDNL